MAVRGIYSEDEQRMLEQWESIRSQEGWLGDDPIPGKLTYPVLHREATKDLILNMANGIYDPNPLFRDESYAKKTRWGSIIAPPFFEHCICHMGPMINRKIPPEVGAAKPIRFGTEWLFYKPIRLGDKFRVWCGPYTYEDKTAEDGNGLRTFLTHDVLKFINQKDEVVCDKTAARLHTIDPSEKGQTPSGPPGNFKLETEEYKYTKEELELIDRVGDEEIIRGADIRWWEDVNTGDILQPIVKGPITPWDLIMEITGLGIGVYDTRQSRKYIPQAVGFDPEAGIWHSTFELHILPRTTPWAVNPMDPTSRPRPRNQLNYLFITVFEHAMARIITNWMGDDGFLKTAEFRMENLSYIGDTLFGRGKVTDKYITAESEHVVDISCTLENIRGYVANTGKVTLGLLSRASIEKDLQRY